MSRRQNGRKYIANPATRKVHDLDNEKSNCNIERIVNSGQAIFFDTLVDARRTGYDNEHNCISNAIEQP